MHACICAFEKIERKKTRKHVFQRLGLSVYDVRLLAASYRKMPAACTALCKLCSRNPRKKTRKRVFVLGIPYPSVPASSVPVSSVPVLCVCRSKLGIPADYWHPVFCVVCTHAAAASGRGCRGPDNGIMHNLPLTSLCSSRRLPLSVPPMRSSCTPVPECVTRRDDAGLRYRLA